MRSHTVQGVAVPALGFGTYKLLGQTCTEGVLHALELGYRHIDTAQMYGNEADVGRALQKSRVARDAIFLTTKLLPAHFKRRDALRTLAESLRKLRTDYVDLLLLHWPNPDVPLEETLGALLDLRAEGAVRHIGVSNFTTKLVEAARQHAPIFCNQVEYHPYLGQHKLLSQARTYDMLLTAYRPVGRGEILSDPVLQAIAAAHGKNPGQICLRWLMQQDRVAAIPKAASARNRVGNIDIFDFELSEDEMTRIFALERGQRLTNPEQAPEWDS